MEMNAKRLKNQPEGWMRTVLVMTCIVFQLACSSITSQPDVADDLISSGNTLAHAQYIEANNSMAELHNRGAVYDDAASRQLIDRVLERLFPGKNNNPVRVTLARLPGENAYALPTGDIVLHQSMLAALGSEAQLAFVLAHEAAHVFLNHAWLSAQHRSRRRVAAHLADVLLLGNSRSYGYFASNVEAYSRQQEFDADDYAANILAGAGYDLNVAIGFFDVLQRYPMVYEAEASQRTHPGIAERKRRLALLSDQLSLSAPQLAAAVGGETLRLEQQFGDHRLQVLERSIRHKIEEHDLPGALLQIDDFESLSGENTKSDCLRGQLYTAIASDVDEAGKAIREIFPDDREQSQQSTASAFFLKQAAAIFQDRLQQDSRAECAVHGLQRIQASMKTLGLTTVQDQQNISGLHARAPGVSGDH